MNYFDQLLESYSKLKKRNLVLLEAEGGEQPDQQESVAREAAKTFFSAADLQRDVQKMTKANNAGQPYAYKKDNLTKVTGGPLGNWTINGATFEDMERQYPTQTKKLINYFDKQKGTNKKSDNDDASNDEARRLAEKRPGRQLEKAGLVDQVLNANMTKILERVTKIAELARKLFPEEYGDKPWTQENRADTYAVGTSPQSLERKLAEGSIATFDEETGFKETELAATDNLDLLRGATASMNSLLSFADGSVTDLNKRSRCLALDYQVSKKGDKFVFHSFGDKEQGVVLKGKLDQLKYAEKQVQRICEKELSKIPKGSLEGDFTPQELADYRGTGLEVTFAGATFYSLVQDGVIKSPQAREKFASVMRNKILKDEAKFRQANIWAEQLVKEGNATDLDSDFIIDALNDLKAANFGQEPEGVRNFYTAAFALEKKVVDQIKPQMSIPVGQQTGAGYKDDLTYVYFGDGAEERARKASEELGVIKGEGDSDPVEAITMAELTKLNPEVAKIYQEAYGLSDDTIVHLVGSSIKSYQKDGGTKAGEVKEYERRSRLVRQVETDQVAPGFYEITAQRLGFDDTDLAEVRSYQETMDSVYTALDDVLPVDVTAQIDADGALTEIDFNTIRPIIEAKIGTLPENSKIKQQIVALFGGEDTPRDLSDLATRATFREEVASLMINYKQVSDCNQKDGQGNPTALAQAARKNLAFSVHMVGGSARDSALNKKVLEENKVSVGSHMEPIMEATLGILDFADPNWDVKLDQATGRTIKMSKRGSGKNISLGSKRKKKKDGTRKTNSTVLVSKESGSAANKFKDEGTIDDSTDSTLLYNFLSGQAKLLEDLLAK